MSENSKDISNPFSTGGGGSTFEIRSQAALLIQMLAGGSVPGLPHWPIEKIKLQGKYAGYNTDDCIVFVKEPSSGRNAKSLIQIKHSIQFTEANSILGEVLTAAWSDYKSETFDKKTDCICLFTGPLTDTDTSNIRPLLEWARQCADENEFHNKVHTAKFSSDAKRNKLGVFLAHLKAANGNVELTRNEIWDFLRHYYLVGYDFDSVESSTLALIYGLISANCSEDTPKGVFALAIQYIQDVDKAAGTIIKANIPDSLKRFFVSSRHSDVIKLVENGEFIRNNIRNKIGNVHLDRSDRLSQIADLLDSKPIVYISGARGTGKSALVRDYIDSLPVGTPSFYFRAEDFNESRLDKVFTSIGIDSNLSTLSSEFALLPVKYLVIESLEKVLELEHRGAFNDLLQFIQKDKSWRLIVSGRDYAYQQISFSFLNNNGIQWGVIELGELSADDIDQIKSGNLKIAPLMDNREISGLFGNLFWLELAVKVVEAGGCFTTEATEAEFKNCVWKYVIAKEGDRANGMPVKRRKLFVEISLKRAKAMTYGVDLSEIAPDVLEDWALEDFIERMYRLHAFSRNFFNSIGPEPAINRAFRLWLQWKLRNPNSKATAQTDVCQLLNNCEIDTHWQDEAITAILLASDASQIIREVGSKLLDNDGEMLKRFCFMIRISCKVPDREVMIDSTEVLLMPNGTGWTGLIEFLYENSHLLGEELLPHVVPVLEDWSLSLRVDREIPVVGRYAGLLAIHFLESIKDSYRQENAFATVIEVILKTIPCIEQEFTTLIERDVLIDKKDQPHYVSSFLDTALNSYLTPCFSKHAPGLLLKVLKHSWFKLSKDIDRGFDHRDIDDSFGLERFGGGSNFFPASGTKGPFRSLFYFHFRKGLNLIIELCNHAAKSFANSEIDGINNSGFSSTGYSNGVSIVEIYLPDRKKAVVQYGSHRLWSAYRGTTVTTYLLQSALMAFENQFIALVETSDDSKSLQELMFKIIKCSNSVLLTSIIASLATAFSDKLPQVALALLKIPDFYSWDLQRSNAERSPIFGPSSLDQDPLRKLHIEDRKIANGQAWRQKNLDFLACSLQFGDYREDIFKIIDEFNDKQPKSSCYPPGCIEWQALLQRLDIRKTKAVFNKEKSQVIFEPVNLAPELKKQQKEANEGLTIMNRFAALALWSRAEFDEDKSKKDYFPDWKDALKEGNELLEMLKTGSAGTYGERQNGNIVRTAAAIVRDHLHELNEADVEWCAKLIFPMVQAKADTTDQISIVDRTDFDGAGVAAQVLPRFFDLTDNPEDVNIIRQAIVLALTHANSSVKEQAAVGIRKYLWSIDADFAQVCVNGSLEFARLQFEHAFDRTHDSQNLKWLTEFRDSFSLGKVLTVSIDDVSLDTHCGWHLLPAVLMLPDGSQKAEHVTLWQRYIQLLKDEENASYNYRRERHNQFPNHFECELCKRFTDYILKAPRNAFTEILADCADLLPSFLSLLLDGICCFAEKQNNMKIYWEYWDLLSDKFKELAGNKFKSRGRGMNDPDILLRRILFLPSGFSGELEAEEHLFESGGVSQLVQFVEDVGSNPIVFSSLAHLAYIHPKLFMPKAISVLATLLKTNGEGQLMSLSNTIYYIERILRRYLLLRDDEKHMSSREKADCMVLLTAMVSKGSAHAYALRDYLLHSNI